MPLPDAASHHRKPGPELALPPIFYFDQDGITDRVVDTRWISSHLVPIPKPKRKGKQLELETEWTADRIEDNKFTNDIRRAVARWRIANYAGGFEPWEHDADARAKGRTPPVFIVVCNNTNVSKLSSTTSLVGRRKSRPKKITSPSAPWSPENYRYSQTSRAMPGHSKLQGNA